MWGMKLHCCAQCDSIGHSLLLTLIFLRATIGLAFPQSKVSEIKRF
jgi:hypothetical protein